MQCRVRDRFNRVQQFHAQYILYDAGEFRLTPFSLDTLKKAPLKENGCAAIRAYASGANTVIFFSFIRGTSHLCQDCILRC
jgi:hypothetical protein